MILDKTEWHIRIHVANYNYSIEDSWPITMLWDYNLLFLLKWTCGASMLSMDL